MHHSPKIVTHIICYKFVTLENSSNSMPTIQNIFKGVTCVFTLLEEGCPKAHFTNDFTHKALI